MGEASTLVLFAKPRTKHDTLLLKPLISQCHQISAVEQSGFSQAGPRTQGMETYSPYPNQIF